MRARSRVCVRAWERNQWSPKLDPRVKSLYSTPISWGSVAACSVTHGAHSTPQHGKLIRHKLPIAKYICTSLCLSSSYEVRILQLLITRLFWGFIQACFLLICRMRVLFGAWLIPDVCIARACNNVVKHLAEVPRVIVNSYANYIQWGFIFLNLGRCVSNAGERWENWT